MLSMMSAWKTIRFLITAKMNMLHVTYKEETMRLEIETAKEYLNS